MFQRLLNQRFHLGSLAVCVLVIVGMSNGASAATESVVCDGWTITVDDSPSPEFVAQALVDLQEYFKPPEVSPNLPWCCYVSNYGGTDEPGEIDDEDLKFFRLADDLDEESTFFRTFWSSTFCNGRICSTLAQFNLVQGGLTELMMHLREAIEPGFDPNDYGSIAILKDDGTFPESAPIDPGYVPPSTVDPDYFKWKLEYGVYPVYMGRVGPQQLSPAVWSATLSATPEPATLITVFVALPFLGLCWRGFSWVQRA